MPRPFIYINSWPGTGKHTIAKALTMKLENSRIIHNHHHIDLVGSILPRSSPQYQQARRDIRTTIFRSLAKLSDTYDYTYIFTDFQTDNELGQSVAEEYAQAAQSRQCIFFPIILTCEPAINAQRMRSQERLDLVQGGKGMLLDPLILHEMRDRGSIFRFECPELLELDVSLMSPEEAAGRILDHVEATLKAVCKIEEV